MTQLVEDGNLAQQSKLSKQKAPIKITNFENLFKMHLVTTEREYKKLKGL